MDVVKDQKLLERKVQLDKSRLIYSYLLLEKNCQIDNHHLSTSDNMLRLMEERMNAGIARQSDYLQAKANSLEANVVKTQCDSQLEVMQSYAKFMNIALDSISRKFEPLEEPLSVEPIKNILTAKPGLWETMEWPLMKLIHSINGRAEMDRVLSTQLVIHTKLTLSLQKGFQVGQISLDDLFTVSRKTNELEKKLTTNRMSLMMGISELKYLLAKPIEPM